MTEEIIDFKIISRHNEDVYCEGHIEIPHDDCEDEEIDWYYWNGQGYDSRIHFHHDAEEITGLTVEQSNEVSQFEEDFFNDALWVDTTIKQSNEDENRTYVRENCILIINEGAKFECDIEPCPNRGNYMVEVIPKFNGEKVKDIASYMVKNGFVLDPYYIEDDTSYIENGHIYFEISKGYFDPNEEKIEKNGEVVTEEMRLMFQIMLFSQIDFENDVYEQFLDSELVDDAELFDLYCWANGQITTNEFADKNGYEWE